MYFKVISVILLFYLLRIKSQSVHEINGNSYDVLVDSVITNIPVPKYIKYDNNIYLNSKRNYVIRDLQSNPEMLKDRMIFSPTKTYTDGSGNVLKMTDSLMIQLKNSGNYKIDLEGRKPFQFVVDELFGIVYILGKSAADNVGKLYIFEISNPDLDSGTKICNTSPVESLGDQITAIGLEKKSGNIAFSIKQENDWRLLVLGPSASSPNEGEVKNDQKGDSLPNNSSPTISYDGFEDILKTNNLKIEELYRKNIQNHIDNVILENQHLLEKTKELLRHNKRYSKQLAQAPINFLLPNILSNKTVNIIAELDKMLLNERRKLQDIFRRNILGPQGTNRKEYLNRELAICQVANHNDDTPRNLDRANNEESEYALIDLRFTDTED